MLNFVSISYVFYSYGDEVAEYSSRPHFCETTDNDDLGRVQFWY